MEVVIAVNKESYLFEYIWCKEAEPVQRYRVQILVKKLELTPAGTVAFQ